MRHLFQSRSAAADSPNPSGVSAQMAASSQTQAALPQVAEAPINAQSLDNLKAGEDYVADEIIIKFKDSADFASADFVAATRSMASKAGATTISRAYGAGMERWSLDALTIEEAIARYSDHPLVEYIQPNYIIKAATLPNDGNFNQLWGLNNTGQTGGVVDADIDAPEAWELQTKNNAVVVGVIDSGVDYTHPDLVNSMWTNTGEIPNNGIDDDNNGYIDDYYGYDFANGDSDPFDDDGHGTHVAGTIAATRDNNIGVAGVSSSAKIMALKFLDASGSGTTFAAIEAIEYATMMGADITNNSWGGGGFSQALLDAIAAAGEAGQLFVAAAGNSNLNNDIVLEYPASYDLDNIISVASTTASDTLSSFSNYGATSVDLGAPGSGILSTVPGGGYASFNGTSMAAPHVTGVASLILAERPDLTPTEVKQILLNSVDPIDALKDITVTGGRLNAYNALSTALASSTLAGSQWNDIDADGVWDENESGLAGWTIFLDENNNGILDSGETSTVTDSDGDYAFFVQAGTYTVAAVLQPGWTQTYPSTDRHTVAIADQETISDLDFGGALSNPAEIQGTQWHDLNGNGVQDDDEPGLKGWTVYLDTNQNGLLDDDEPSMVTDANGDYTFTQLPPGTYTVAAVSPVGWEQVSPTIGIIDELFRADFSDADGAPSLDGFTLDNTGRAAAGLWHLSTGRGNQSGHSGDDSLYFGTGEGPNGGGNYNVGATAGRVTSPMIDLTAVAGAELTFNYVLTTEKVATFDVAKVLVAIDGGEFEAIATNSDILQDPTEGWIAATLDLGDYVGHEIQVQFDFDTNDNLANNFEGWYIDDVVVNETSDGSYQLTLEPDEVASDIDFGNKTGDGEISGTVWHDLNGDTTLDPDEPGLVDWTVFLDQNQNGTLDPDEQSTTSDADGAYEFANLATGDYTVAQIAPSGWQQTFPLTTELFRADFSDEEGNPNLDGFTIDNTGAPVSGLWHLSTGRGTQPGHSAADSLYFGTGETDNGGGNYDVGHTAGRVTSPVIDLTNADEAELLFNYFLETERFAPYDRASILVAEDGGSFEEIANNFGTLQDWTSGWTAASLDLTAHVGHEIQIQFDFNTLDGTVNGFEGWYLDDVVVNATNDGSHPVSLNSGDSVTDINFGNQALPGEITGQVWNDLDGDGVKDSGEWGLQGWTVFLDQNQNGVLDNNEVSTRSDEAGDYAFTDLEAGSYTVAQILQPRWQQTAPNESYEVELEWGATESDINFGNQMSQIPRAPRNNIASWFDPITGSDLSDSDLSDSDLSGSDPSDSDLSGNGVNVSVEAEILESDDLIRMTGEDSTSPIVEPSWATHNSGASKFQGSANQESANTVSVWNGDMPFMAVLGDRSPFTHLGTMPVVGPIPEPEDNFTWPGTSTQVQFEGSAWGMATSSQPLVIN
ncbi:MAG: S8 family serine peptidase [Leptolyngbyaceae cyanobacterium]